MKAMELLTELGSVKNSYVIGAGEFRQGQCKAQVKRLRARKAWLIAAIIALMLLLVGCAVVYVLRLQDMKVGEELITREAWTGPSGEYVPPTEWVSTRLLVQGYNGSPEQLAMEEWLEYEKQYDPEDILRKENNRNESGVPEQYFLTYDCYTFEMMVKLNEILDKYKLKPLGAILIYNSWEEPLLYKALQINSLCRSDVDTGEMSGYFFPEGCFHGEFRQTLAGEQESRIVSFTYAKNGYLYPYIFAIKNLELWEQWHYTTLDGTDVLLAIYENALVIICDCGDGFIHISTENNLSTDLYEYRPEPMTRQEAEKIADSFNYSIRPQSCDPNQVEAMRADYPEPEKPRRFLIGFRWDMETDLWFAPEEIGDSFAHYISYILESGNIVGNRDPDKLDYCIVDLNNDGQQEILLRYRDTGKYRELFQMADFRAFQHQVVSIRIINGYLYEGPVFENIYESESGDFVYHDYMDYSWNEITSLRYDPKTNTWMQKSASGNSSDAEWEAISESEAIAIQSAYTPLSLEMKPLSEFPMDG